MQLHEQDKEKLRAELHEKLGILMYGTEIDSLLDIVQKHTPKSFSRQVRAQAAADGPSDPTDAGIQRAEDAASEEWKAMAMACIEKVCRTHVVFTADEVYEEIEKHPQKTHNMSAMGALMLRAKKNGWCIATADYKCSTRPVAHRKPMIVWKSLLRG